MTHNSCTQKAWHRNCFSDILQQRWVTLAHLVHLRQLGRQWDLEPSRSVLLRSPRLPLRFVTCWLVVSVDGCSSVGSLTRHSSVRFVLIRSFAFILYIWWPLLVTKALDSTTNAPSLARTMGRFESGILKQVRVCRGYFKDIRLTFCIWEVLTGKMVGQSMKGQQSKPECKHVYDQTIIPSLPSSLLLSQASASSMNPK